MTIRGPPAPNDPTRPDNTQRVDSVRQANNRQLNARSALPNGERRKSFNLVAQEGESAVSGTGYVQQPIQPGASRSLLVAELGQPMPYSPEAGFNVISESVAVTASNVCRIETYLDGDLINSPYIPPGQLFQSQIAALQELGEFVDELDGSHTLEYRIVNLNEDQPLEGNFALRAIERDVS